MNVNSVMASFWTQFQQNLQVQPSTSAARTGAVGPSSMSGAASSVSDFGQMLAQLQQLEQSNPTQFKSVMTSMSQALGSAAQQGGAASTALQALATDFANAAATGSLSGLTSGKGASGSAGANHHHHHHSGAPASGGATGTAESVMDQILAAFQAALGSGGPTGSAAPAGSGSDLGATVTATTSITA